MLLVESDQPGLGKNSGNPGEGVEVGCIRDLEHPGMVLFLDFAPFMGRNVLSACQSRFRSHRHQPQAKKTQRPMKGEQGLGKPDHSQWGLPMPV